MLGCLACFAISGWPSWVCRRYASQPQMHDTSTHALLKCVCEQNSDYEDYVNSLSSEGKCLLALASKMSMLSVSTAFSGIDTPGTALHQVCAFLRSSQTSVSTPPPRHVHAVEWSHKCQAELLAHPGSPGHIFSNIEDFLQPAARCVFHSLHSQDKLNAVFAPLVTAEPAKVLQLSFGLACVGTAVCIFAFL